MAGQNRRSSFNLDSKAFEASLRTAVERAKLQGAEELQRLAFKVVNKAQRYAPVDTGRLRNSIGIKGQGTDIRGPFVDVGTRLNYAPHVEYGTGPHEIRPQSKKALANRRTGFGPVKSASHPGTAPQPFIRPALLEAAQEWAARQAARR